MPLPPEENILRAICTDKIDEGVISPSLPVFLRAATPPSADPPSSRWRIIGISSAPMSSGLRSGSSSAWEKSILAGFRTSAAILLPVLPLSPWSRNRRTGIRPTRKSRKTSHGALPTKSWKPSPCTGRRRTDCRHNLSFYGKLPGKLKLSKLQIPVHQHRPFFPSARSNRATTTSRGTSNLTGRWGTRTSKWKWLSMIQPSAGGYPRDRQPPAARRVAWPGGGYSIITPAPPPRRHPHQPAPA